MGSIPTLSALGDAMSYRISLIWKILVELTPEGSVAVRPENGLLFNRKGGRSFMRGIGGSFRSTHAPVVLEPTDAFHQALSGFKEDLGLEGSRFPVTFVLEKVGCRVSLNVSLHLYGSFVCATCRLEEFTAPFGADLATLQDFSAHPKLHSFISRVLAITINGDRRSLGLDRPPKVFPCIRIVADAADSLTWKEDLVGLVTRHPNAPRIIDPVLIKNAEHQLDESLLLFDKQGVAGYVPFGSTPASAAAHEQRFRNATSMIEYAGTLQRQLAVGQWVPVDTREAITNPAEAVPNSVSARYLWVLAVKEFSLQSELKHWSATSVEPSKRRILLVTVTTVESKAVHAAFAKRIGRPAETKQVNGFVYQLLGQLGEYEVIHAISGMGSGGLAGSQESVRRSIQAVNPQAVLMVGIAFGIDSETQDIGDVLVSRQVLSYELQRVNNDFSIHPRGDKVTASPKLLDWVAHAEITWDETKSKVRAGLLLSGEKLVDNLEFRKRLVELAPDAVGGEMEAAGLYVACQVAGVDWICIKAICDWADGDKGTNKKSNQARAAVASAEFALHVLTHS